MKAIKTHWIIAAVFATVVSGFSHLLVASAQHKGIPPEFYFFIGAGAMQLWWAFLFWQKPTDHRYHLGIIINGGLAILWVLTRTFNAPFVNEPEHVDLMGALIVSLEIFTLAALGIWHHHVKHKATPIYERFFFVVVAAFLSGFLLYSGARLGANTVFKNVEVQGHHGEKAEHEEDMSDHRDDMMPNDHEPEPHDDDDEHHD
jgi:hypothetical protein